MLYHQCHTVLHCITTTNVTPCSLYHYHQCHTVFTVSLPPMSHRVTPCYTVSLPPMSHCVTPCYTITTTNVTPCYTVSLPPMSHRVTLYHLPTISGGWGGPPVLGGWPAWGVLPPCLWWTGYSLAACNAHAVPPARAVALPCCGSVGVWGCGDVSVCVRVWVCVWEGWEGCEGITSRTKVKLTYWVQTELRWYRTVCAFQFLASRMSKVANQRAEFKNSAI